MAAADRLAAEGRRGWRRWRLGAIVAAGAILVALVATLLWVNYRSATRVRQQVLAQHQKAFQLRAAALAHFVSSAGEDLRYLADSREVAGFYENRDLGMSMEYGLGMSLFPVRERLRALVVGVGLPGPSRFTGVALIDADGTRLSEAGERVEALPDHQPEPVRQGGDATRVELSEDRRRLVVTRTHWFKGRFAGRVVGWLRPGSVAAAMAGEEGTEDTASTYFILDAAGRSYQPAPELPEPALPPGLADLPSDGRMVELASADGQEAVLLGLRVGLPGQPLSVVDVDDLGDLVGPGSPAASLLGLALAAAAVLGVVLFAVHATTRSLALGIRLEESLWREREVGEKHAALERVERERRRLWQAVNQSPALVVITDAQGQVEFVNPTYERLTGYAEAEALGRQAGLIRSGAHPPAFYREVARTLAGGATWSGELCARKRWGELFWLALSISPARDEQGVVTHLIALGEDITARRLAAQELERARDEAQAANKAKSAFLANMSHEIRTPLNAILGYSQLMTRDDALGEGSRRSLEIINRSGEHLLSLLNEVLEISRIEAGRVVLEAAPFDLHAMLRDLTGMFLLKARDKGLEFEVERGPELPQVLVGDEGKVRQVLVNLLGNAVKFTRQGGVVLRVEVLRSGARLRLRAEVTDTGPGIAREELSRLFREFEQTSSGRALQSGTGLGLAISRGYARLLGGDLTVTSEPGQGSAFRLELPVEIGAAAAATAPAARRVVALRGPGPGPRILLVDDQEANRDWLRQVLQAIGFELREAADGHAAMAAWRAWAPALVLMDLRMPGMGGLEATRAIRAEPGGAATRIVVLTASALESERDEVLAAGADAVLTKPVREPRLLELMGRLLGLEYLEAEPPAAPATAGADLTPAGLAGVPAPLLEALRQATRRGDIDRMGQLIDEVDGSSALAAAALRALAARYDYDALHRALG
ncbi:MAG: response regulator [Anaeromyxobacter sp.]|nr:response regulator [Anaeromyxobacter sp.]MBL0276700.1 response regulator [Anaeromyxobacter sp.]